MFVGYLAIKGWRKNIGGRYYFFVILFSFLWLLSVNVDALVVSGGRVNSILSAIDLIAAVLVAFSFTQFSWRFPVKIIKSNFFSFLQFFVTGVVIVLPFVTDFFPNKDEFLSFTPSYYAIYISGISIIVVLGCMGIFKNYKASTGIKKKQLEYVALGFLLPMVFLVILSAYVSIVSPISPDAYIFFSNTGLLFSLLSIRAIFRYRLLNLRQAVGRAFVYTIFYGGAGGILLISLLQTFRYLVETVSLNSEAAFSILFIFGIGLAFLLRQGIQYLFTTVIFPPLYKAPKVDAPILKGKPELPLQKLMAEALPQIQKQFQVKEMGFIWYNRKTGFLEPFAGHAYKSVFSYQDPFFQCLRQFEDVRIAEEIILEAEGLNDEEAILLQKIYGILEKNNISMLIPFGVGDQFFGAIVLGKRKGGNIYSEEDVAFARKIRKDLFPHIQTSVMYYNAIVAAQKQVST